MHHIAPESKRKHGPQYRGITGQYCTWAVAVHGAEAMADAWVYHLFLLPACVLRSHLNTSFQQQKKGSDISAAANLWLLFLHCVPPVFLCPPHTELRSAGEGEWGG